MCVCVFYAVRSCPALSTPQHGQLNCSNGDSSARLECAVRCQKGYRLEGKAKLTCLPSLQWSSPPPRCVGKLTITCGCVCVRKTFVSVVQSSSSSLTFKFMAFGRHSCKFKAQECFIIYLENKSLY